jgi:t-SNARE complex subunit (syntaxin)
MINDIQEKCNSILKKESNNLKDVYDIVKNNDEVNFKEISHKYYDSKNKYLEIYDKIKNDITHLDLVNEDKKIRNQLNEIKNFYDKIDKSTREYIKYIDSIFIQNNIEDIEDTKESEFDDSNIKLNLQQAQINNLKNSNLNQREEEIKNIHELASKVNEISEQAKTNVKEQADILNDIESNIIKADENITKAEKEIVKAKKDEFKSKRCLKYIICLMVIVISMFIYLIYRFFS